MMTVLVIVLKGATSKQKDIWKATHLTFWVFFWGSYMKTKNKSKIDPAINMSEGYISATKEAFEIYGHA